MKKSRYILIGALLAMACIITTCYFQMERDNINDWAGDNYVPEYPTPGFSGVITFTDIFSTSLTVNWTKASDLETAQSLLQYKLVRSLSNNITTVSDAEANGTLVMDWTADTTSINVTGLTMGMEYYFNILVKDEYGNTSAYTSSFLILNPIPEEVKRLIASDGEADDWFGACEISSDGSTIVVGANGDDVEGKDDHGSAYVFVKPEGGWGDVTGYAAKLIPSDGEIGDRFAYTGLSISSDGSTIVIGIMEQTSTKRPIYVFERPSAGWVAWTTWNGTSGDKESARLYSSDGVIGASGSRFGWTVSISSDGEIISAGAPMAIVDGKTSQGSAYIFEEPSGGWASWTTWNGTTGDRESAKLTASDSESGVYPQGDKLGYSVSVSDDGSTVVAGAYLDDDLAGQTDVGSAYIFEEPSGGWGSWITWNGSTGDIESAKLTASDAGINDRFGSSTSILSDGSGVVIGAPTSSNNNTGSAYIFLKTNSGWEDATENAKITAFGADSEQDDYFGHRLSIASSDLSFTIVVGAMTVDIEPNNDQGAAYIFEVYK